MPSGYVVLTFKFSKEDDRWVGDCVELGTSAFGDTVDEALEVLKDLVALHLNELETLGERRDFFRDHGIKFYREAPEWRTTSLKKIRLSLGELAERQLVPVS
jgi:predicted RNase H-like HicB family nuclease